MTSTQLPLVRTSVRVTISMEKKDIPVDQSLVAGGGILRGFHVLVDDGGVPLSPIEVLFYKNRIREFVSMKMEQLKSLAVMICTDPCLL